MSWRRAITGCAFAAALACMPVVHAQAQSRNLEYEVKAGFLRHFLTFIDWPASTFPDATAPFRLCVFGRDPFGAQLDEVMRGESVGGRPIRVERGRDDIPPNCQVIYTVAESDAQLGALQRVPRRQGLLIVGESRRVFDHCGAIVFVVEGERVRFDVNLPALSSRGLIASAKLLRVAREVWNRSALCD